MLSTRDLMVTPDTAVALKQPTVKAGNQPVLYKLLEYNDTRAITARSPRG